MSSANVGLESHKPITDLQLAIMSKKKKIMKCNVSRDRKPSPVIYINLISPSIVFMDGSIFANSYTHETESL